MCVVEETSGKKNQSKVLYRIYTFHNSQLVIVTNTMKEEVRIDKICQNKGGTCFLFQK